MIIVDLIRQERVEMCKFTFREGEEREGSAREKSDREMSLVREKRAGKGRESGKSERQSRGERDGVGEICVKAAMRKRE